MSSNAFEEFLRGIGDKGKGKLPSEGHRSVKLFLPVLGRAMEMVEKWQAEGDEEFMRLFAEAAALASMIGDTVGTQALPFTLTAMGYGAGYLRGLREAQKTTEDRNTQ